MGQFWVWWTKFWGTDADDDDRLSDERRDPVVLHRVSSELITPPVIPPPVLPLPVITPLVPIVPPSPVVTPSTGTPSAVTPPTGTPSAVTPPTVTPSANAANSTHTVNTTNTANTAHTANTVAATPSSVEPATAPRPTNFGPTIAVMNFSTVVSDAEVQRAIAALQIQLDRDFRPLWGMTATLQFVASIKRPPINAWVMQILDSSDVSGALGYHDMTNVGLPVGRVFAKDDKKYNLSWTVTLSHELLEMLGDPYVDTTVFVQDSDTTGTLYAYELCDAVEDDSSGYMINNVLVSNFVTPAFFESQRQPNSTKFDFGGVLTTPLSIAVNGYLSVFAVRPSTSGWTQRSGAAGPSRRLLMKQMRIGSRVSRRKHPHNKHPK